VAVGGGVPVAAIDGGAARWAAVTGRGRGEAARGEWLAH
jgi:hypothetical protein